MTADSLAVTRYLRELYAVHAIGAGTPEESFYPCLHGLLETVGQDLDPAVLPISQPRGVKADYGLFTPDQVQEGRVVTGGLPNRGAIEVKPVEADLNAVIASPQVARYLDHYGKVLVTNYRAFSFLENGAAGTGDVRPLERERFELAQSSEEFWSLAAHPVAGARAIGPRFLEFLQRVLRYGAPLRTPRDLAWFLASYAREARLLLETTSLDHLSELRGALEEALDVQFADEKGQRFFRSTVVQTLFYGLFSAWVLWHRESEQTGTTEEFTWHGAGLYLRVPVMQALFDRVAMSSRVQKLGLKPILDRATQTLARVDHTAFFQQFRRGEAIQYFYEPFLEAFDPKLRKELGVWYTPPEVVNYMVDRIDQALRDELDIAGGLADDRVVILDPCCGTGAYLVAVLQRIARALEEEGAGDMRGVRLKQAVTRRVFGFEILTASFVVAHLQIGLFLQDEGAPLGERERAAVYLTNALTGWQRSEQHALPIPELADERDAAAHVKQDERVVVVLGNPPYDGYAGMAVAEERKLVEVYRKTRSAPRPSGAGLNDPYVRFFRMAERMIVERPPGHGVVCLITNSSWLKGSSHSGMRERFLTVFDHIRVDDLHGDKYDTGKLTPDGRPDPSIFSTRYNREGIQVGTAICLLTRLQKHDAEAVRVDYRSFWGADKLRQISSADAKSPAYQEIVPSPELGAFLIPGDVSADYLKWPSLPDLFPFSSPGVKTSRDRVLVDVDRGRLEARIQRYLDPLNRPVDLQQEMPELVSDSSRFDAIATRQQLLPRGFERSRIIRYDYRPFDQRWLYWEPETALLDRERSEYVENHFAGNLSLVATGRTRKRQVEPPLVVAEIADLNLLDSGARIFPLYRSSFSDAPLLAGEDPVPNLSPPAKRYLASLGLHSEDPEPLFFHAFAMLHAPDYLASHVGGLRQSWPRIPLPGSGDLLRSSSTLGRRVVAILDPEQAVLGVTTGRIEPPFRALGVPTSALDRPLNPVEGDFGLTAGWGYSGRGGITMPGHGRSACRAFSDDDVDSLSSAARELLGESTLDIYLNDLAYWKNVPEKVWTFTLGGYPVLKKWLSYRERTLLGRELSVEEVTYFQQVVRRIAALLLLAPDLNSNYLQVVESAIPLPGTPVGRSSAS